MTSILTTTKKALGIDADYTAFDTEIIMHINSVLMGLTQIGVGPPGGFFITDSSATWAEFLGDSTMLEGVKTYVYIKVRLVFDTTASATILEALTKSADNLEWRINVQAESAQTTVVV